MKLFDPNNATNNFFTVNNGTKYYLWCATARDLDFTGNTDVDRERTTVYMKGLSFREEYGFTNGITWKHRRIIFATKGVPDASTYNASSGGMVRTWLAQDASSAAGTSSVVFAGTAKDWSTPFTAQLDRKRVHVLYDKTRLYRAGNQAAHSHSIKTYLPLERNFTYADEEDGGNMISSPWSSNNRNDLGDVFVWDIFTDVGANSTTDTMTVRGDATLYWHEK